MGDSVNDKLAALASGDPIVRRKTAGDFGGLAGGTLDSSADAVLDAA